MLFNSKAFLVFLPIVFFLYWFVFRGRRLQNLSLLIASYIFYGWWDWRFLLLIAFTSLCSYVSGILIERNEGFRIRQRVISGINIILNISILAVFKYYNFFVDNLDVLLSAFGWHLDWVTIDIILPVGISFYTFQALSYSIDVYQRKIPATHEIVEFFAYISFFPQLVAGPIERANNLLPQFQHTRVFDYAKAVDGMRQMLWGFFKKLVIADNCAYVVNTYWDQYQSFPSVTLIMLGVMFTFQIYCDFSGYSDIAIGCARLFGFNLMLNFDFPYFSRSIPEFWRRWHISLMSWFRDYIYFPLGGSRCSKTKCIRNIVIVWAISGLWHGANWTFINWGLFHAMILVVYIILGINTKSHQIVSKSKLLPSIKEFFQIFITFALTVVGWIIFRAESMTQAIDYLHSIVTNRFFDFSTMYGGRCIIFGLILLIVEWLQRDKQHALQFPNNRFFGKKCVRWFTYVVIYLAIISFTGRSQTFIYFQF